MVKKSGGNSWLQTGLVRVCRIHFVLIAVYGVYIIASDGTRLITPQTVLQRWGVLAFLLSGVSIVWYLARAKVQNINYYRTLLYIIITMDISLAAFNIYSQRGMASRAVVLFALPIVVSTLLLSRTAIFFTASLCTAAYGLAAVKYFTDYFNEGYKAELYIEVGLYCAFFFILAAVLSILISFNSNEKELGL